MESLICLRLCGTKDRNLTLWLGSAYRVTDRAEPHQFLPWLYVQLDKLGQETVLDKLFQGYHWKQLTSTDLALPPTTRWDWLNETGPLRQPPLKDLDTWTGWVYAFDKVYHTLTVYYQENYKRFTVSEYPLAGLPDGWVKDMYYHPHNEELEQEILLRYAFDFAIRLYEGE